MPTDRPRSTPDRLAADYPRLADPGHLRAVLAGVRGFVLDADGVIVSAGKPIRGSFEALATLHARRIPFRIVTNFSLAHRSTLTARFGPGSGLAADGSSIITAASAAAAHTARAFPGGRILVLSTPDALREWEGQALATVEEADDPATQVDAVVIGDAGDDLPFHALDVAFRRIRAGAALVAMHRNLWWLTGRGPTLDSGALVLGLEAATGRRAVVAGKPSPVVFRQAVREIAAELAARDGARHALRAAEVAMVGDDVRTDVLAARRLGLRGVLVLSGKHSVEDVSALATDRRRAQRPLVDAVAPALSDVVAALD